MVGPEVGAGPRARAAAMGFINAYEEMKIRLMNTSYSPPCPHLPLSCLVYPFLRFCVLQFKGHIETAPTTRDVTTLLLIFND